MRTDPQIPIPQADEQPPRFQPLHDIRGHSGQPQPQNMRHTQFSRCHRHPSGGKPCRAWLPRTIRPVQAATVAAKAWTCLLDQAAPLLRAAGSQQDLLFLSGQGEPLVRSRAAAIAAMQLTAAGLPGLTARSVGTLPGCSAWGRLGALA